MKKKTALRKEIYKRQVMAYKGLREEVWNTREL